MNATEQVLASNHDVEASLGYYTRVNGRAVVYQGEPGQQPRRVGEFDHRSVSIADGRPVADRLTLDGEGFELRHSPTTVTNFYDDALVRDRYYAEVEALIKEATGARKVHIFDHTIRVEEEAKRERVLTRAPVQTVHNPDAHRDEAVLIKSYDSSQDGRARFTPHTAFTHPGAPADAAPRESIEVRALVSFD